MGRGLGAGGLGRGDTGESPSGERASEPVGNMGHCQTVPRGHLMVGYGFYFQCSQAIFMQINFFLLGNFTTKICHQLGSFSLCHIKQEVASRHCEVILFSFIYLLILFGSIAMNYFKSYFPESTFGDLVFAMYF